MRILLLFIVCLVGNLSILLGQPASSISDQFEILPIDNLSSKDTNYKDLQFLKNKLKDKRIVMLGEQSHGDGATFEAKVKLIKFLHQEMNFDLLCFESGLYDNYVAYNSIHDQDYINSPIKESVFGFWSETKEFQPLIQYIHTQKNSVNPLMLAGFDCQEDFYFKENYFSDLKANLTTTWNLTEDEATLIEQTFSSDGEDLHNNPSDSTLFFNACKKVIQAMNKLESSNQIKLSIQKQTLISWLGYLNYTLDEQNGKIDIIQNRRDELMAKNLIAIANMYPEKKIICWGASYHFANKIEQVNITPISLEKLKNIGDGDTVGQHVDHFYKDAIPMGKILKKEFGNSIYAISFSSFEGKFGMLGAEQYDLAQVQAPNESVEKELADKNISFAFLDFSKLEKNIAPFYLSALGNIPLKATWNLVFDAHIFIKSSFIPQLDEHVVEINQTEVSTIQQEKQTKENKKIIDSKTKKVVDYAQARILKYPISVVSNSQGEFNLDISSCKLSDKIIFSCMGYTSDTIDVKTYLKKSVFEIKPTIQHLQGVRIFANQLSAKEIVMRAEQAVKKNYRQLPYKQHFIYRHVNTTEDTVHFKKESSVIILNEHGINSGKVPKTTMYKLKERIQRSSNKKNQEWGDFDISAKMFNTNVITLKNNPLHRFKYYQYSNNGMVKFEDRDVYEIKFECIKPSNTAIGMGSKPLASIGTIYIDVENFAVLKFVQEVNCAAHTRTENSEGITYSHIHHVVQTYSAVEGKYYPNYFSNIQINKTTNETTHQTIRGYRAVEFNSLGVVASLNSNNQTEISAQDFENQCHTLVSETSSTLYQILETQLNLPYQSNTK